MASYRHKTFVKNMARYLFEQQKGRTTLARAPFSAANQLYWA
jgi:ribosomal protein L17